MPEKDRPSYQTWEGPAIWTLQLTLYLVIGMVSEVEVRELVLVEGNPAG